MDIYVLGHQMMGQKGSSLLRLIQNTDLPKIDLLVRESIQNSMDAGLTSEYNDENEKKQESRPVEVEFCIGSCDRCRLDPILTGITTTLAKKIPGDKADFIAIRDRGTTGLTGPLREDDLQEDDDIGNLRKLIYEISCPQLGEGKGGSWGLGKTVYFRVGIGIVFYYSRILMQDGTYASRMAATLIEDETCPDSLLKQSGQKNGNLSCGVAWWGQTDGNSTMPVTDEEEIVAILDIFNLKPYTGKDTGTTILIPYIDREELKRNGNPQQNSMMESCRLEDLIWLSVQRWYAPRLENREYPYGPYLSFLLNNRRMSRRCSEWKPFFKEVKDLYNQSFATEQVGKTICLRNEFADGSKAGYLEYKKLTRKELCMEIPDNEVSPYVLLHEDDPDQSVTGNPVIICYCRKPGMIVNYEIGTAWTNGVQSTCSDEVLLALFRLESNQHMKDNANISLEEYIRKAEPADHMMWCDQELSGRKYRVVEKLRKHVARELSSLTEEKEKPKPCHTEAALQKKMGGLFLPPTGFGRLPTSEPDTPPPRGESNHPRGAVRWEPSLTVTDVDFVSGGMCILYWEIAIYHDISAVRLEITAVTENKEMSAEEWEDENRGIGRKFPFCIIETTCTCDKNPIHVELLHSGQNCTCIVRMDTSNMTVSKKKGHIILTGRTVIEAHDEQISSNLRIWGEENQG